MAAIDFWQTFKLYCEWSSEWLFIPGNWQITLALIVNLLVATLFRRSAPEPTSHPSILWACTQFLFPPILLFVGVLERRAGPYASTTQDLSELKAYIIVFGFLLVSLAYGLYWVKRLKGNRWFATSLLLFQLWWMHAAAFIAGMSITGDWI